MNVATYRIMNDKVKTMYLSTDYSFIQCSTRFFHISFEINKYKKYYTKLAQTFIIWRIYLHYIQVCRTTTACRYWTVNYSWPLMQITIITWIYNISDACSKLIFYFIRSKWAHPCLFDPADMFVCVFCQCISFLFDSLFDVSFIFLHCNIIYKNYF